MRAGPVRSPTAGPARTRLLVTAVGEAVGMRQQSSRSYVASLVTTAPVPDDPRQTRWCVFRGPLPAVIEADDGAEFPMRSRCRADVPGKGEEE